MGIKIGPTSDQSRLALDISLSNASTLDIDVGEGRDMSVREINVVERDQDAIVHEVEALRRSARDVAAAEPDPKKASTLEREANGLADTVMTMIREKRWLKLSIKGVLAGAQAVGVLAGPVAASAIKIMELVVKLRG